MTRVAVGGFLHETNTFAPTKATYDDFAHGGGSGIRIKPNGIAFTPPAKTTPSTSSATG